MIKVVVFRVREIIIMMNLVLERQKEGRMKYERNLNHYYHSARYKSIAGNAIIICLGITFFINGWMSTNLSFNIYLSFSIIWMLFTMIYPEINYLNYASKDRIYYLKKNTYDGNFLDSVRDGIAASNIFHFIFNTWFIISIVDVMGILIIFFGVISSIISFMPFIFVCMHVTSLKTKIWCFFKYVVFYNVLLMQIIIGIIMGITALIEVIIL